MVQQVFVKYSRQEWQQFNKQGREIEPVESLANLVSLNDRLTQQDVEEVYQPLLYYIDMFFKEQRSHQAAKAKFFEATGDFSHKAPFIIGISGSVAVGKSTTARVLQQLLENFYPHQSVELMTTDGFLYPNAELERRGIMNRKGFPESYDMPSLIDFMTRVKLGEAQVEYPIYDHEIYDIVPDRQAVMDRPDILIIEGINVFQLPQNQQIYMSDFFDFTLYIDADTLDIKEWYTQRYLMHLDLAKDDPDSYYYPMTLWPEDKIADYGNEVWYTINLTNLVQYIAPTKERADVILHKGKDHYIDEIYVRKY